METTAQAPCSVQKHTPHPPSRDLRAQFPGSIRYERWQFQALMEVTSGPTQRAFIEFVLFESSGRGQEWTPPLTYAHIANFFRVTGTTSRNVVNDAVRRGLVERRQTGRPCYYQFRASVENWERVQPGGVK